MAAFVVVLFVVVLLLFVDFFAESIGLWSLALITVDVGTMVPTRRGYEFTCRTRRRRRKIRNGKTQEYDIFLQDENSKSHCVYVQPL